MGLMDYEAVIREAIELSGVKWVRPENTPLDEHLMACVQRLKDQRDGHHKKLHDHYPPLNV